MATAISNTKYEDIITNSDLIRSGSPAVYQLRPKKKMFGTLTRKTVGEKDHAKKNKTILLVGETRAGKSTLINALVNYTMGVKFEDNIWFQLVEEEESQTSDVIVYEIFGFGDETLPYSLTIIDTPGYNSTGGIEHDAIISQRLLDLFRSENGVHKINAVSLVVKASENRLSDRLRYIFDSVVSLFGKNMEENIVALITHSDGRTPTNVLQALDAANIKCAKNEMNQPVHFMFDNCHMTEENETDLKIAWDLTKRGMHQFTEFLKRSKPLKLSSIKQLNSHIRKTACITNLQERIKLIELKQREIQQTQEGVKKYEQEMKKNEKFTVEIEEVYKEKEAIDGAKWWLLFLKGAVCCKVCEENCHYPGCTVAQNHEDCEVMKNGRCTSCTGKCPVSDHVKENWRFVTKTKKVQRTVKYIKEKYEKTESEKKLSLMENLENNMKELTAEKNQLVEESYQHVVRLEEITLNVNSVSTHVHLDFLIEKMKEKGDTEKVRKLEEMESQMDEGTKAVLEYMISSISSKYEHIISKSASICSGSPAVYQLRPEKEMIGTLTRKTLGEKNINKINKTILLVGETGTGKSTLINALVNYTLGVKFEDNIWFQIVEEEKRNQSESQTSDVIVYEIFGFEDETLPYSLTIIDTPGYGDTRGTEHDAIISQKLFDLFCSDDGVDEINAVGLVMKASDNRLSDRLRYIFDSVMSLFGKDMENKIVALVTHSDGTTIKTVLPALEAANIKCAKNEKKNPVHFQFNNCQSEQRTEENQAGLKSAWDLTNKEMGQLKNFLERSRPQKLKATIKVLKAHIRITACIQNLRERIEFIEGKQTEFKQTQEAVKKYEQEMKKNEEFTVEVEQVYKEKEPIRGGMLMMFFRGAVTCKVCEENCHYPGCTMAWYPEHCQVMNKGRCTSCTKKCPVSAHVKENWTYVKKTKRVKKTEEDVKKTYEKNKAECEKKLSLLENLDKTIKDLKTEKDQLLEESYKHVVKLDQIALNVISLSTYVHFDFLIEKMKEKGDTEKVQKLEEMKSRMDEGTRAGLRYMWGKLKVPW